MISKQQFKWLKTIKKNIKKRENIFRNTEQRENAESFYREAKKNPQNLRTSKKEEKNIIKKRKLEWKRTIFIEDTPIKKEELQKIIAKKIKYSKPDLVDVDKFIIGLHLQEYLDNENDRFDISVPGDLAIEEYITEKWSKLWLPLLAVIFSLGAIIVSIISLFLSVPPTT